MDSSGSDECWRQGRKTTEWLGNGKLNIGVNVMTDNVDKAAQNCEERCGMEKPLSLTDAFLNSLNNDTALKMINDWLDSKVQRPIIGE